MTIVQMAVVVGPGGEVMYDKRKLGSLDYCILGMGPGGKVGWLVGTFHNHDQGTALVCNSMVEDSTPLPSYQLMMMKVSASDEMKIANSRCFILYLPSSFS